MYNLEGLSHSAIGTAIDCDDILSGKRKSFRYLESFRDYLKEILDGAGVYEEARDFVYSPIGQILSKAGKSEPRIDMDDEELAGDILMRAWLLRLELKYLDSENVDMLREIRPICFDISGEASERFAEQEYGLETIAW